METIAFYELPQEAQDEIERYPEDVKFEFFWDASNQEIKAVEANLIELAEAQGTLEGLVKVEF